MDKVVDMEGRERCIRRLVQNVRRSVKFLLSLAEIVRYTVKSVSQNTNANKR